jgi:hypothetical protein
LLTFVSYGTLLGTSFFHVSHLILFSSIYTDFPQTFINGTVMFRTVERPAFSAIQSNLFPIYFGLQTGLPIVLALTFPGSTLLGIQSSIPGLLDASNRWGSLVPILTIFVTGLTNLTVLLPVVTKVMKDRRGQGAYTTNRRSVLGAQC